MGAGDRRIAAWVDLIGDLLMQPTGASPHRLLSAGLSETFGCQVSWNWMDPDGSAGYVLHHPMRDWPASDSGPEMAAAVAHHPVLQWYGAAGDMAAMTIGRVPRAMVTDQGRALVREHFLPVGIEQQMAIPYRLGSRHYRSFTLARSGRDFSDEDLRVALQLQPLLRLLDRQRAVLERDSHRREPSSGLTGRELAVLQLLADGMTAYSIGRRLDISVRTVHRHLHSLYFKLNVSNRVRAVVVAREAGLLPDGNGPAAVSDSGLEARRLL
jgi:DNA-binding CsgD family transcriptional regulator